MFKTNPPPAGFLQRIARAFRDSLTIASMNLASAFHFDGILSHKTSLGWVRRCNGKSFAALAINPSFCHSGHFDRCCRIFLGPPTNPQGQSQRLGLCQELSPAFIAPPWSGEIVEGRIAPELIQESAHICKSPQHIRRRIRKASQP
jgi:hypothetical protein